MQHDKDFIDITDANDDDISLVFVFQYWETVKWKSFETELYNFLGQICPANVMIVSIQCKLRTFTRAKW